MHLEDWLNITSSTVFLFLAVMAAVRARASPLAPALSQTCAGLFAYQLFETLSNITGQAELSHVSYAAASVVVPSTVSLVLQYIGHSRRMRWLTVAGFAYFVGIALVCVAAIFVPSLHDFPGKESYALLMLAGFVPAFFVVAVLLARHARRSDAKERARTWLLALALIVGVGGASSDLASIAGASTPRVAVFGLVASAVLLTLLALRFKFLDGVTGIIAANVAGLACVLVLGNVLAAGWAGASSPPLVVMSLALSVAAVATLRPLMAAHSESRARARYLQTLGRFSAQMAHDLKNPLSAIRGAAQFLVEERRRGASIDDQAAFVELILEQADRLARVVSDYQRLGRAEAVLAATSLVTLAQEIAQAQRTASPTQPIEVRVEEGLDVLLIDRDLVAGALENLVKNAQEAGSQQIVLGASRSATGAVSKVRIWVEDDGSGMDERTRELALDEFFTTKSTGTGLGLAFVGRVAEAHGGRVKILDRAGGQGTRVEMEVVA